MSNPTNDIYENNEQPKFDVDFADVVSRLTESESVLTAELKQLASQSSKLSARLNQVQTALAALRGQSPQRPTKPAGRSGKGTPTEAMIGTMIDSILRAEGATVQTELISRVKQQLLSQGVSRVGVKPMLAKTLTHPRFKIDHDGSVSLACKT